MAVTQISVTAIFIYLYAYAIILQLFSMNSQCINDLKFCLRIIAHAHSAG